MFGVEDLLVSHGYKVSKNSLSSCQQSRNDGDHQEDNRSGSGMVNGFKTDQEVFAANPNPLAKSSIINDHEKGCVNKRRQINSTGHHKGQPCFEACHNSETGIPGKTQMERSYWTKTDKDVQYWRRRGQDFSVLLGYRDDGVAGGKIISSPDSEGQQECSNIDRNAKESYSGILQNMENTGNNAVHKKWKKTLEEQPENVNKNTTKDLKINERDLSDGHSEKTLQEFISCSLGDNVLGRANKLKSQSLPKVLSPDSVRRLEVHSVASDSSQKKEDKCIVNPDCRRSSFSKPKYSRPLKPPSYELHQQTWGAAESNGSPDNQKDDRPSLSSSLDSPQDSCFQESGLEPPIYIPPPSYKSPPLQHATNQYLNKVPTTANHCRPNHLVEKTSTSNKAPISYPGNFVPYNKLAKHGHADNCRESVQYISFEDPRIKHFAGGQDTEKQECSKKRMELRESKNQETSFQKRDRVSAFTNSKNAGHNNVKREGIKHKQWLHISIPDQICYSLPEHREGSTACSLPDEHEPNHKLSLKKTHSDSACETVTKVRKFEPEAYLQNRKSSKRRLNETIFCLVSIPVKSDSNAPEMSKKNKDFTDSTVRMNMLKHTNEGLHEQTLLSASSSDLELQTLTGSMNNNIELLKQAQPKTEENKQTSDLRSVEQRKHRELVYSGSWPGDQYKDQQTQTVFTDIQNSPRSDSSKTNELHDKCSKSHCVTGPVDSKLPTENGRLSMFSMKGQMSLNPSSNSAFSRTSSLMTNVNKTEACQRLPFSNEITNEKGNMACGKNELEDGNPCNKKEVFGQFLLKPVSRRPWDAISELESLNKEFQEQERTCDGDKNVAKEQVKGVPMELSTTTNAPKNGMVNLHQHVIEIQEIPLFEIQDNSKSESRGTERSIHDNKESGAILQKCAKIKDFRSKSGKSLDECLKTEIHIKHKRSGNITHTNNFVITHVDQSEKKIKTHSTQADHDKFAVTNLYHFRENKNCIERPTVDVEKMTSTRFGQIDDNTLKKLSLADKSHGLSVPDLTKHFASTNHNGELHEEHQGVEIPENESLFERAARILGIEVADDSLVSTESSETQSPEILVSKEVKDTDKVSEISFSTSKTPGISNNGLHSTSDAEGATQKLVNLDQSHRAPLVCSPNSETNVSRSAEKRLRNTSKMIETLQGKLASTPVRTAVDRLARMKEVDSVSRIRRLSIKSTDSGDEIDDDKHLHRQQDPGPHKFSAGSIYKRVISLDESLLINTKSRETLHLPFADAYDPARVERV
ncbi:junctional cadherin 5-associated protein [Spea bombifrons]|uniref:junctional cadherin 5-associated protein n=1 Tax=Spea bombifrons TaxID=233779 RepID=UPI00234BB30B|nr:junctional cadherin 5-associated protein [Spea bombifrons]XP_053322183.1 junctional cadherin 5-associated protein [Spea bombifrons]